MENEEKAFNPQESLRVIRETIDLAKSGISQNGFHFLLWGWLVVIACLGDYYMDVILGYPKHTLAWMVMTVIGLPVALIYEWRRDKKQSTAGNTVVHWYGRIWLAFGISLIISTFLSVSAGISPIPNILILVGFATFISGSLLRFSPLIFGAIAMWAGAFACQFLNYPEQLLVQAVATAAGYLVPGYLLNKKARNRHV